MREQAVAAATHTPATRHVHMAAAAASNHHFSGLGHGCCTHCLRLQARALAASNERLEHRLVTAAASADSVQPDPALHPDAAAAKLPNGVSHAPPAPASGDAPGQAPDNPDDLDAWVSSLAPVQPAVSSRQGSAKASALSAAQAAALELQVTTH